MARPLRHLCPQFQSALSVLSRPWSGLILTVLQEKLLRFAALSARMEVVGDRMLSLRLKDLEARGLIERRVLRGPPVGVEYALTASGRAFGGVVKAIESWAHRINRSGSTPASARESGRRGTRAGGAAKRPRRSTSASSSRSR